MFSLAFGVELNSNSLGSILIEKQFDSFVTKKRKQKQKQKREKKQIEIIICYYN